MIQVMARVNVRPESAAVARHILLTLTTVSTVVTARLREPRRRPQGLRKLTS